MINVAVTPGISASLSKKFVHLLFITGSLLFPIICHGADWIDPTWTRRTEVTVHNASSALVDYQVRIDVTYDADMKADFSDLRITDADGITVLSHWIQSYTASTSATVWVKVPTLASGESRLLYMYYGNPLATSTSNGAATFIDFDDFNRSSLGTNTWTKASVNPLTGTGFGDPFIFQENDTFYLFADAVATGSIVLYTSSDPLSFPIRSTVLEKGGGGTWDSANVRDPSVQKIGSTYYMWYAGTDESSSSAFKIGLATAPSLSGPWTKSASNPILSHVSEGMNEPSVLYEPDDAGEEFKMLYTAGVGTVDDVGPKDIGYAISSDGILWSDQGDVLQGAWQDQEVVKEDGVYYMFVNNGVHNMMQSFSLDHRTWTAPTGLILSKNETVIDTSGVFAPSLTNVDGIWYMYYQPSSGGSNNRLAVATGSALFGEWSQTNPLTFTIENEKLKKQSGVTNIWNSVTRDRIHTPPYIMETDVTFLTETTSLFEYGLYFADNLINHLNVIFDPSDDEITGWKTNNPSPGTISAVFGTTTAYPYGLDTSYVFRGIVTGTGYSMDFYDGTSWHQRVIGTGSTVTKISPTGYYGYSTGSNYTADNYRIRAYAAIEPTITVGVETVVPIALESAVSERAVPQGGGRRNIQSLIEQALSARSSAASAAGDSTTDKGADVRQRFVDVPLVAWFHSVVEKIAALGIISGYTDAQGKSLNRFGPADSVTVGQIIKIALLAANQELPVPVGIPKNPTATDWSAPYIALGESLKLSLVSEDVHRSATRGEVISTLLEAFEIGFEKDLPNEFTDLDMSHPNAAAILTAAKLGIVTGDTNASGTPLHTVRPNDQINRAEVATLVVRMLEMKY